MSSALSQARIAIQRQVGGQFVLLGVSGGSDSLGMAVAAAELVRAGKLRAGAVIVDHQLAAGSDAVARQAAETCRSLGLDPVLVRQVSTAADEASARHARYQQFEHALGATGAQALLLAHTLDDQAEQVLLGLLRGSGTRSLAGIRAVRGPYRRPLLGLRREQLEQICRQASVNWWQDPSNTDVRYRRNQIRHRVLPVLVRELGAHLPQALAGTAELAAQDADALDEWAAQSYRQLADGHRLPLRGLRELPPAISSRVLRLAVRAAGGTNPSRERTAALQQLAGLGTAPSRSAGPVQLEGEIYAYRRGPVIVFTRPG
ncbi:tRNA(Ile)-lysidine synthase [Glutamicibacter creatinolyticus]|uniref:tRNA(Ile)-lysidine synthase n=2 Tax=Glutamicibacter creatinolyticus TaxID=162496 RepID=A0A5B7WRD0_9MICC|nr:tRNA lysidine(34) synthetase TilS [Glutamicibacter creatinolyticus]QCY45875.1 tRNA(Ile)-lysidine synthase [Glutamicibacter creatinolyticus]